MNETLGSQGYTTRIPFRMRCGAMRTQRAEEVSATYRRSKHTGSVAARRAARAAPGSNPRAAAVHPRANLGRGLL